MGLRLIGIQHLIHIRVVSVAGRINLLGGLSPVNKQLPHRHSVFLKADRLLFPGLWVWVHACRIRLTGYFV